MALATVGWTALFMGLAGGAHCLAMCSAPCHALVGTATVQGAGALPTGSKDPCASTRTVAWKPRRGAALRTAAFHTGRLAGYSALGALAAVAMDSLAWLTRQSMALQPVWTFMHVAMLGWGLLMVLQSRQPRWVEQAGRALWNRVQPCVGGAGSVLAMGVVWALMPCGLLYSALLVAALSGGPVEGAVTMALFAMGTGVWLIGGPWAWKALKMRLNAARVEWGSRLAGGLLCGVAGWALWMDLVYKPSLWCR